MHTALSYTRRNLGAVLGYIMPPQLGLFFIAIKPQVGIGVAVFWLVEAWRKGGWRSGLKAFWPFTAVLVLSMLLDLDWPLRFGQQAGLQSASLWPMSIPVSLALLAAAVVGFWILIVMRGLGG